MIKTNKNYRRKYILREQRVNRIMCKTNTLKCTELQSRDTYKIHSLQNSIELQKKKHTKTFGKQNWQYLINKITLIVSKQPCTNHTWKDSPPNQTETQNFPKTKVSDKPHTSQGNFVHVNSFPMIRNRIKMFCPSLVR